jgi:hypothetical protein
LSCAFSLYPECEHDIQIFSNHFETLKMEDSAKDAQK